MQRFGWGFHSRLAVGNPILTIKMKFNCRFPSNHFLSTTCDFLKEGQTLLSKETVR